MLGAALLAAGIVAPRSGAAQGPRLRLGVSGAEMRIRETSTVGAGVASGFTPGAEGSLSIWKVRLEAQYLEGHLQQDSGSLGARDVVEGSVFAGIAPVDWVSVKFGIHARSYTSGGTERWVFWETRIRAEAPLNGPAVRAYAEVWRALSSDITGTQSLDRGQGGQAGLVYDGARVPLWVRLGYGIEDVRLGGGARRQTVELLVLALGVRIH